MPSQGSGWRPGGHARYSAAADSPPWGLMSGNPPLDPRTLAALRALSGPDQPDLHVRLARKYVAGARAALATMVDAAGRQDHEPLENAVHDLKGSSGNVGALTLFDLCDVVEQAAAQGRVDREGIRAVEAEFERVLAALQAEFGL